MSRPFTFVKDGVFYFSRRIPKELRRHYTSPRIAYSLRTRSARIAEARARRAADQLDEYWYHLRSREVELPGKHMLRLQQKLGATFSNQQPAISASSVLLSEAVGIYLQQKGNGLVTLTFRPLNSFRQPFVRRPRGFCHLTTNAAVVDYRTH
ncbi:DUF6538 domain-containing protein [Pseudorhodobacter wandonensis]|uniref:DUF6538 domain-containing protein n=1 Tax=Pseudorhodobacter wandonensis TaxID=1120568 RepID=UPI002F3FABB6